MNRRRTSPKQRFYATNECRKVRESNEKIKQIDLVSIKNGYVGNFIFLQRGIRIYPNAIFDLIQEISYHSKYI